VSSAIVENSAGSQAPAVGAPTEDLGPRGGRFKPRRWTTSGKTPAAATALRRSSQTAAQRPAGINLMETISVETRAASNSSWLDGKQWHEPQPCLQGTKASQVLVRAPFFRRVCQVNSRSMAVDLRHLTLHSFRRSAGGLGSLRGCTRIRTFFDGLCWLGA
jgi:hypothetical protein